MLRIIGFIIALCFITKLFASPQLKIDSLKSELENLVQNEQAPVLIDIAKAYWTVSQEQSKNYANNALELALHANNDTLAIKAYLILSAYYSFASVDTAEMYVNKILEISEKLNRKGEAVGALLNLGVVYFNQGEKFKAISYYNKALQYSIESGVLKNQDRIYTNLGVVYKELGDYKLALEYLQKSLDIREKTVDKSGIAYSLHMIGIIYSEWGSSELALDYYSRSLAIKEEIGDKLGKIFSYTAIAKWYHSEKKYSLALDHYKTSYEMASELGNKRIIYESLNNLGDGYKSVNKIPKALQCYQESLIKAEKINNLEGVAKAYENIGDLYYGLNDFYKAINFYTKSIGVVELPNYQRTSYYVYKSIANAYAKVGNNTKAFENYKHYAIVKDSVFTGEKHKQIVEMQTKYETEKKENEIELLNAENKIKESELAKQRVLKMSYAVGLFLMICFFLILALQYRQKHMAYEKLVQKNQELIKTNSETEKYEKSALQNAEQDKIVLELISCMKVDKLYTNTDLTIGNLAKLLKTNSKYLSQVINSNFNMNFNSFINELRIKEAQVLLTNNENNKFTIEAIANSVGFNNKASFNSAFKKYTGVTPSFYKKSLQFTRNVRYETAV